jgi:YrbI family 3-deoxy-D-manno-octulosonate 8-phosphate phosphatase
MADVILSGAKDLAQGQSRFFASLRMTATSIMSLTAACEKIELILSDVDGVMTDGGIHLLDDGQQMMKFHIRDGMGVRLWREAGKRFGIVTGRNLESIRRRAADLWLDIVRLGIDDKLPAVDALAAEFGLSREQVCYVGDDLLDLATIRSVGLGIAVADAVEDIRRAAKYVTSVPGGSGAIREVIELILKNTGRWDAVMDRYGSTTAA